MTSFPCDICNKDYKSEVEIKQHYAVIHPDIPYELKEHKPASKNIVVNLKYQNDKEKEQLQIGDIVYIKQKYLIRKIVSEDFDSRNLEIEFIKRDSWSVK